MDNFYFKKNINTVLRNFDFKAREITRNCY